MLNYAALKAADAALDPQVADPAQAASALNAQTVTQPPQAFSAMLALNVLLTAGEWPKVVVRSEVRPLDLPTTAALSAVALLQARGMIDGSDVAAWTAFSNSLSALLGAGDISQTSVDAIVALRTPTVPKWPVVLTGDDVTSARSLP